jgi:hypothetical protein
MKGIEQKPEGPAQAPRNGVDRLRAGIAKWAQGHPVHVVVEVTVLGDKMTFADDLVTVAEKIDEIMRKHPEVKFSLVGFGTASVMATDSGEED